MAGGMTEQDQPASATPLLTSLRFSRESDAVWCRQQGIRFASQLGFEGNSTWEIAIAISELVSNAVKFASGGQLILRSTTEPRFGIEITVTDRGPGISDVDSALMDGFSEGRMLTEDERMANPRRGLGTGLGAVQRMMDSLRFENRPGGGLRVVACKWNPDLD